MVRGMATKTIKVDDLPVEVDRDEYRDDPEGVEARVREARANVRMPALPDDEDPDPDYNTLYPDEDKQIAATGVAMEDPTDG